VTFDTKLRQQKVTSKAAVYYGSETRTINKIDPPPRMEAPQTIFLTPTMGLNSTDR